MEQVESQESMTTEVEENQTILSVESLSVEFSTKKGSVQALRDVSLSVDQGQTIGIAGESGSGKSTLALAILQYLEENGEITSGSVKFKHTVLGDLSSSELQSIRGDEIAHIPQDPNKSLNPSITVGEQIAETIRLHQDISKKEARERTHEILAEVNISDPEYNAKRYPHELSGGMQQRALIAMALSCNPELLILDEPTTGLDVTTQTKILDLIRDLKEKYNTSIILITHDLGVIAETVDNVAILYAGEVLEQGPVTEVFTNPANPYTQGLLAAIPKLERDEELRPIKGQLPDLTNIPSGCVFADRCEFATEECRTGEIEKETVDEENDHWTRCRRWETAVEDPIKPRTAKRQERIVGEDLLDVEDLKRYFGEETFLDKLLGGEPPVKAVNGVNFSLNEGETLSIVGESGCGKSTLGKTLLRLLDVTDGQIRYRDQDIASLDGQDLKEFQSESGVVFQNPDASLNPKKTVFKSIARPLNLFTDLSEEERKERVIELLDSVEVGAKYASRFPHELSGGEKQRVAIARAFAANPSFVVLDEPVSALDVSVQASIINLLEELREEYGSSYVFVSHDLSVVNHISDRVAVMYLGEIAELGSTDEIFEPPYHPYTRALLSSIPSTDPTAERENVRLEGDVPSARNTPNGCPFHTRCPQKIGDICEQEKPELETVEDADGETHEIACHLEYEEMMKDLPGEQGN
jgi:peptide/nickel transport system ATP-binding protein